ncbi:hypothetical protein SNOG_02257 [Parastagonospora nodorum SN15]|uniref:Zn(2)-C6 fungal-type domain-containing protein n=1 Tax=Phaeosphaeria nodorum (strain SN15 / ATCC MYA-4574 / FGSC 10173) TaxID=321614 RepID=Q0V157_PHANO|nr:hypothetical protein SNOG_02257 [Parastagonospora nodorum SN15]EAT90469.2 hypothetical protein SNOG_02257 [Parastagonospora nodorum SN15]
MAGLDAHTATERTMTSQHHAPALQADLKRKRSPSHDTLHHASAPLAKSAKTHNHLQINYLARQLNEDLPLITNDDTLPNILSLLGDYQGVLDRHESMACNLGARPLGPILIKRFERLFDGPPRVLKSHGKDGTTVTWLDVVDFARNKPEQFQLGQMSEGVRVCQFYTKQCRVQISEEDFVLISSGIPQKMIPPQPIIEDEEKELGTIEILEKNLGQICQLADQGEFLLPLLKGRKQAILDRRATASPAPPIRPTSPSNVALMNGAGSTLPNAPPAHSSQTSPSGFVAVNARPHHESNGNASQRNSQPLEKDDGGPFKTEMVHKMEALAKGERILPPCDRCRRLHMDCLKNLTACMGCTKKHAKCSWKEVREGELRGGFAHPPASNSNVHSETSDHDSGDRASTASPMLTPPHHSAHTPQNVMHQPAQHQAEPPSHRPHATNEQPPQHHSPYDLPHNARIPPSRNSPPERDRARESNVETQLQEAAKSSVVHSNGNGNTRLGGSESSNSEFHQPMVA